MNTLVSTAAGQLPPPSAGEDELRRGAQAGPWVVEYTLGSGGMGAVYAVVHEHIGKRAALKVLHRWLWAAATAERILLEARVVNRVGHANVVDIFETGKLADGRPYIVMERLDGMPLGQRVYAAKLAPDRVIAILLQICDALHAAHAAGIVHRDLKLDNVFLLGEPFDPNPRVKLLDWGIAKEIASDVRHTVDGQLVGTPQYLAPEQARGAPVSAATDVYSLGVMAYELFLDQLPFEAETAAEIMTMHLRTPPPPPREIWSDMPVTLERLLLAMLAKSPGARPSISTVARTFELVRDELACQWGAWESAPQGSCTRWASAPALSIEPPAHWRPTTKRWQLAIGVAALVASATMFGLTRPGGHVVAAAPPPPIMIPTSHAIATRAPIGAAMLQPVAQPAPVTPPPRVSPPKPAAAPHHHAPTIAEIPKFHHLRKPGETTGLRAACAFTPKAMTQISVKFRKTN